MVDNSVLDMEGAVISDRNASSEYACFCAPVEGLQILDFDMVYARSWTDPDLHEYYRKKSIKCAEVGPVMYQRLSELPIGIEIYAPFGTAQKELSKEFLSEKQITGEAVGKQGQCVNEKWYLILEIIRELNNRRYSLKVGRTIYQKICFVLTRNGVDTGFTFSKGTYGPFSPQVRESIRVMANANLIVEKQLGQVSLKL